MKRATEEKIRAIKRKYLQLEDLIKAHKKREDPDPELLADLKDLALRYQAEGFQKIPED